MSTSSHNGDVVQARAFNGIAIVRLKPTTWHNPGWTEGVAKLPADFYPLHADGVNDMPEAAIICTSDAKVSGILHVTIYGRVDVYNPSDAAKVFGGCVVYATAQ